MPMTTNHIIMEYTKDSVYKRDSDPFKHKLKYSLPMFGFSSGSSVHINIHVSTYAWENVYQESDIPN